MAVQLSLLGREAPELVSNPSRLTRIMLDAQCWIEHQPGFVQGHARLFAELEACVPFREERRMMYEREVDVPRLVRPTRPRTDASAPLHTRFGRACRL